MRIDCLTLSEWKGSEGALVLLGMAEGQRHFKFAKDFPDAALLQRIERYLAREGFSPKKNEVLTFDAPSRPAQRVCVVILGKDVSAESVRQASGRAADFASGQGYREWTFFAESFRAGSLPLSETVEAMVEGVELALYHFDQFKPGESRKRSLMRCRFVFSKEQNLQEARRAADLAQTVCEGVNFARDLVNTPANELPPRVLAERARAMAADCGISFRAFGPEALRKMKMGGILAVGQGSREEPRLVVLEYGKAKSPLDFAFVGKGVTFDSGGISIKPSDGMEKMKYDMAGGAAVLGLLRTISKLALPLHAVGIVPAAENMPGGSAYRPGDVIWMGSGKSVEILNTDAEGRLLLGDGLFYAQRYKPKVVVDLATLTGACVVALGNAAIGLMGNDERIVQKIKRASEASGERVWELPLWDDYFEQIKSDVAEIKNVGGKGAGTITAAMFLKQFVSYPWAHLDIAGTAWADEKRPLFQKGATGVGVRLLTRMLRDWRK